MAAVRSPQSSPRTRAKPGRRAMPAAVLYLRIDFGEQGALGPGKTRLMELIAETGSISAAGRAMGMSYRRAWLLVDSLKGQTRGKQLTWWSNNDRLLVNGAENRPVDTLYRKK